MESLNERLAALRAEKEVGRDPAVTALMNRSTDDLRASGILDGVRSVGDTAPDFELLGSDGRIWRLRDLLGESGRDGVVLAWFPKAFTPG